MNKLLEVIADDNIEAEKRHNHLMATNWNYAIKEHIKTGLESPTPYKVIAYKNGIGIKKIEFFKSSLFKPRFKSDENIDPFADIGMGFKNLGKPLKE